MSNMTKLLLRSVVEAIKHQNEETLQFFDRISSEIVTVTERDFRIAENWGRISGFRSYPPNEIELIERACDIMSNTENYIPLPRRELIDYKKLMTDFIASVKDTEIKKGLRSASNSILGNKYKKFKDAIDRYEINDRWLSFTDSLYYDMARVWCEKNNLLYIDRNEENRFNTVYDKFRSPSAEHRGKPFWSWNGKLEKEELLRQLNIIREMGFGGFFMHSRTGLATEYLGNEWFDLINACADEAGKLGMEAWLYDEDRWPSGSAGGMATEKEQNRAKLLRLRVLSKEKLGDEFASLTPASPDNIGCGFIAAFNAELDGLTLQHYSIINHLSEANESVLVFDMIETEPHSFYNGNTYLDTLSRPATDDFIKLTHERYAEKCGDRLGKSIKGIFTDEPHNGFINTSPGGDAVALLPFTYRFAEHFKSNFGYDMVRRMPELLYRYKGESVAPIKWQYMETLQRLFLENFVAPISQWCDDAGISLTGHFLHEDTLAAQAVPFGSLMRGYELMHCPGVDVLTEHNRQYCIALQLKSAARQTGKKKMLSELYGATGWQMNFQSHKAAGDWQALYGINIRCPHLSWYTMEGEAKRDYPASILHQSPWYSEYRKVEDYFARIGIVMEQGEPECDILYITPIESLWAELGVGWNSHLSINYPELKQIEETYSMVWNTLVHSNIEFDFGDEEMISRLGSSDSEACLRIGKAVYTRVLICGMITMRSSTLELLQRFAKNGGQIIFAGEAPAYIDCIKSDEAAILAATCKKTACGGPEIAKALAGNSAATVSVSSSEVLFRTRRDAGDLYIFMINENRSEALKGVTVKINHKGYFQRWDAATGNRRALGRDIGAMTLDFAPSQEYLFIVRQPDEELPAEQDRVFGTGAPLDTIVSYELNEPNVCVLDRACLKIEDEDWQPKDDILRIDDSLRDFYRLPRRGGSMLQPWFTEKAGKKKHGNISLRYEFDIECLPESELNLIAEHPEHFKFNINGSEYDPTDPDGFFIDNSMIRLPLPASFLREGRNILIMSAVFDESINLEAIFLTGEFGVRTDGDMTALTVLPETLNFGRLDIQGLPFYSGKVTYKLDADPLKLLYKDLKKPELYKIGLGSYEGACVVINPETDAAMIGWKPSEAIIKLQDDGIPDTIDVELVLTRRNIFGPLHQKTLVAGAYSPESFRTTGDDYTAGYSIYPSGLFEPPVVYPQL
ncbi:MAG: glycosyl hydrolase family 2 protein [Eubacteriales bacterium]